MSEKSLQPIEQKEVELYGDEVTAVRLPDGQIYVSLSHMCEALGVNRASQMKRIQRNGVLAEAYQRCAILTHHRGRQVVGVLRADMVPLWLTGISTNAVKDEIRDKLANLQRNAARILWEAFQAGELTLDDDFQALMNAASDDAVQAYLMVQAMLKLAKQQIVLEAQVSSNTRRLEEIEAALGSDDAIVTPDQAMQISQGVKAVAIAQGKQSGRNEFGATYGELYRRFGINSYKQAPAIKFKEILSWLNEWYQQLTNENLPF